MQKISEAEMEIMKVLWEQSNSVTSREVMDLIPNNQWKITTLLTLISRLIEKGFIKAEKKGRGYLYSVYVSEQEYKRNYSKNFLKEIHEGSIGNFFAALYPDGEMDEKDLQELKEILGEW